MWKAVAVLFAGLSLAPQGAEPGLRLVNERVTYGLLGPVRPDLRFVPGDTCYISFDIQGLKLDPAGKVRYRMELEVLNAKGEREFKKQPQDREVLASLGGDVLPAFASIDLGVEMPPGKYTLKVIVSDSLGKGTATLTRAFDVLPRDFALVRPQITFPGDIPAPPQPTVGQDIFINVAVVGFDRAGPMMQPNVALEMRVLDEKGQPTLAQPFTGEIKAEVPKELAHLPGRFLVKLNRPGKFTVQIKATDRIRNKTAELSLPLVVLPPLGK
jgi:hypothetical protein